MKLGENLGPPILDDSLAYKIVDELETWKERQTEIFKVEVKLRTDIKSVETCSLKISHKKFFFYDLAEKKRGSSFELAKSGMAEAQRKLRSKACV